MLVVDIKGIVKRLKKNHNTCDPFRICEDLDIVVRYEELGAILGFHDVHFRMKSIYLNASMPDDMLPFVCAHELGHTILHPNVNTPFLRKHTLFSIDRTERQANTFAIELLLPDDLLDECSDINFATVAKNNSIPEGLEELKRPNNSKRLPALYLDK